MSQAKVDRYKKEKAGRKKMMRREKIKKGIRRGVYSLVALCIALGIGFTVYSGMQDKKPRTQIQVNYDSLNSYMSTVQTK